MSAWLARNERLLSARQLTWISNPSQAPFLSEENAISAAAVATEENGTCLIGTCIYSTQRMFNLPADARQ